MSGYSSAKSPLPTFLIVDLTRPVRGNAPSRRSADSGPDLSGGQSLLAAVVLKALDKIHFLGYFKRVR